MAKRWLHTLQDLNPTTGYSLYSYPGLEVRHYSSNMESTKTKAKTNIKNMVKLGWENKQFIDTLEQVYSDNAPNKSITCKWTSRFKSGRNEIEDESRSGRSTTSVCEINIDAVRAMIEKNRRITTESVADTLSISVGSAHTILVEIRG
ncbi:protein GVQW3-like [Penaeus indicus]|uniref:protein GVQW3-like n=1 Tax=Penaeus indicus TaxID=29960 RepID=UPI00300CF534